MTPRRTILLSGACGSGKTSIAQLGYRRLAASWGPTATLDTDTLYLMVDPHWALPYDERRNALVLRQRRHKTPEETVDRIATEIARGCGRLTDTFGGR